MILPVLLYHGERRWNQPLRLLDLCAAEGRNRELLGPGQPSLSLTLIDLSRLDDDEIETAYARGTATAALVLLLMKSIRATGLLRRLGEWIPILRRAHTETGGRQTLELLVHYLLQGAREEFAVSDLQQVLSRAVGPEAEELVMNTGERLIQKGKHEGMREALASVLRSRFADIPESVEARIESADLKTLQRYLDLALVVESLEEVIGDSP